MLQELLAPSQVVFFTKDWMPLGTKSALIQDLMVITRITASALIFGVDDSSGSIAQKMSWAVGRETTREEDRAYSLLGLFGVNMPLLYGEGPRAFRRLQEEILKTANDHSIFAWQRKSTNTGLLASSPDEFEHSTWITSVDYQLYVKRYSISHPKPDFAATNFGLHIQLPLEPIVQSEGLYIGYLACKIGHGEPNAEWLALFLQCDPKSFSLCGRASVTICWLV